MRRAALRLALLPTLLAAPAALAGCSGDPYVPERVAVTLYAAGPPAAERPAIEAVKRVIARNGGVSGVYRISFSWQGVPEDAPLETRLAAARRAVRDARAVGYVDAAGGRGATSVVQLLNLAGVPAVNVADPGLARALCTPDPYPSGRRTAVAPQQGSAAARAAAATQAIFDALRPMDVEFSREPVTRALLARFGDCP